MKHITPSNQSVEPINLTFLLCLRIIFTMIILSRLKKIINPLLFRRAIVLIQVIVMVMLAVPVCCYELEPDHEKVSASQTAKSIDANHDECPCCPDENNSESNNDTCSTCSYCTYYAPLAPLISTNYNPSVAPVIFPEEFVKLSDVHIPIFIPPQNLA